MCINKPQATRPCRPVVASSPKTTITAQQSRRNVLSSLMRTIVIMPLLVLLSWLAIAYLLFPSTQFWPCLYATEGTTAWKTCFQSSFGHFFRSNAILSCLLLPLISPLIGVVLLLTDLLVVYAMTLQVGVLSGMIGRSNSQSIVSNSLRTMR